MTTISLKPLKLRYVTDAISGIQRVVEADTFQYVDKQGLVIDDPALQDWIASLGIPPAWTDVWISPYQNGHILAMGRDAKGRKQYRYHPKWNEHRSQTKFDRLIDFSQCLLIIRETTDQHLRQRGLSREKVLAVIVRLLEKTLIRVGNREYARDNEHYGLTTLHDDHIAVEGGTLTFQFVGKSGKEHAITVKDKRLANAVKAAQDLEGQHLFQYVDKDGTQHAIGSGDVNTYLREISGQEFTAKDFRTWGGSTFALETLAAMPFENISATDAKRNVTQAVKATAAALGNTPAICRKYYIHPRVIEAYPDQNLAALIAAQPTPSTANALDPVEQALVSLLQNP